MQQNLHSYYKVAELANRLGAQSQFDVNISDSNEGDRCARQLRLTEEQLQVVLRDNKISQYVGLEAPNCGGAPCDLQGMACGAGINTFCITPEGNLQPCCAFPLSLGNLNEQSLTEILTNNAALKQWQNHTLQQFAECGRHDYCDYCNLCAGRGQAEHGDWHKPAENCCYMAKIRYNLAHRLMEGYDPLNGKEFASALQALPKAMVMLKRQF
jgi:MoaA/NifB/PqqE/SkfB family radical SAM enzyme